MTKKHLNPGATWWYVEGENHKCAACGRLWPVFTDSKNDSSRCEVCKITWVKYPENLRWFRL